MVSRKYYTYAFAFFLFVVALVFLVQLDLVTQGWHLTINDNYVNNICTAVSKRDNRAFATIVVPKDQNFALAMAQNFVDMKSKYPLLILVIDHYSNATLSADYIRRAKLLNAIPIILEKAPMAPTVKIRNENYKIAWHKLSAWKQLINYSKIALLDLDMLILGNADELLDMPDISFAMGTCDPCEEPWGINGGLLVFEPSVHTYERFLNLSQEHRADDWQQSEQQLLREYYTLKEPSKAHVLSRIYNANVNSCACMPKHAWNFMKILHWGCERTTGKAYHWTKAKIEEEMKKELDAQKKCVHQYNLKWLDYYERAIAYTNPEDEVEVES